MSDMKSIWHKLPEQPENGRDVIEKWHHLGIHYTHFVAKNGIAEDNPFTDAWCYLDDLLELETELERTRKALDAAINAMKSAGTHNSINCIVRGEDPSKDDVGITINRALEQIIALEQKDVK